ADADLSGGEVDDAGGNKERRDLSRSAFHQRGVLALDDVKAAYARADVDADVLRVFRRHLEARHVDGLGGGGQREVNEAAHLLQFFFLDEVERVEVLHLGRDGTGILRRVKECDGGNPTGAGQQACPHCLGGVADTANHSKTGDNDSAAHAYFPPFACAWT